MSEQSADRYYITTSIPYVNGEPHIGFGLEAIQCDVLARYHRQIGDDTRFLSGTDENALTNVQAAEREGIGIRELVDRNAPRFEALREPLRLTTDDFIRTSSDPRHEPGAQKLWRTLEANGDIYSRQYQGLYCVRCERFYKPEELINDKCPIHRTAPDRVDEENYFFRLSAYEDQLRDLITSNEFLVQPEHRREEILSFINQGLEDFSISRQAGRGHGWGVPVPGDDNQVMYVWVDALSNYITALDYATDGELFERYWLDNPNRVHVVGKDIIRFHVIYWPAMLLAAKLPIPSVVNVHEFLSHEGEKMSKSRGNVVDPVELVEQYGSDAVRYWLLREMPRTSDGDFSYERLERRYNVDLANDLGNLINRSVGMLHRYCGGVVPSPVAAADADPVLHDVARMIPETIDAALARFDFRGALAPLQDLVTAANRYVDDQKPWELNKAAKAGDESSAAQIDVVLGNLIESLRLLAVHLAPFIPDGAARIAEQLNLGEAADGHVREWSDALAGVTLPKASPVFPRIEQVQEQEASSQLIGVDEARRRILDAFAPLPATATPIQDALGLTIAEDVAAAGDLPPFTNSAMDGYAVRTFDSRTASADRLVWLRVSGRAAAGSHPNVPLEPGCAVRIMTGAPVPNGADAVVRFEETDEVPQSGRVGIPRPLRPQENIRPAGEDAHQGEIVLTAKTRIRPAEIGLLAAVGRTHVTVHRRPKIAVLVTGDEVVDAGTTLQPGQIWNSNGPMIAAQVRQVGGDPIVLGVARDTTGSVRERLAEIVDADLLITTGGVSVGDFDVVKDVLQAEGRIDLWQVRLKPGRPLAFGSIGDMPLIGLPGNPVAAYVAFAQFARPAILTMLGRRDVSMPMVQARLLDRIENRGGCEQYVRVRVDTTPDGYVARIAGRQGSGMLTSLAKSNGLLMIPEACDVAEPGMSFTVQMPDWDRG